jgi:hypothetical protein
LIITVGFGADFKGDLVCDESMAFEVMRTTLKHYYANKFLNLINEFKMEDGLL